MDEPPDTGFPYGRKNIGRADDIAGVKACTVEGVDDSGDMDNCVGAFGKPFKSRGFLQRSRDPFHAVAWRLLASGDGANLMPRFKSAIEQPRTDEAGRAGYR